MSSEKDSVKFRFRYHHIVTVPSKIRTGEPSAGPIVVGAHGSPGGDAAVRAAAELAKSENTDVVLVHAMRIPSELVQPAGWTDGSRRALEKHIAEDLSKPLRDAGVGFRALLVERPPAKALVGVAEHFNASRIVIGLPHRTNMAHLGLGDRVTKNAPCAVLAVPTTPTEEAVEVPMESA